MSNLKPYIERSDVIWREVIADLVKSLPTLEAKLEELDLDWADIARLAESARLKEALRPGGVD